MRRELLAQNNFTDGYNVGVNVLAGSPSQWADGSSNQLLLADGVVRPFGGYTSKGVGSGVNYAAPIGSDWGGLSSYDVVVADGNILQDYSQTLFEIGRGKANKSGTLLQKLTVTFNFANSDVTTGTGNIHHVAHGLVTGQAFYFTGASICLGLSANTPYWVIKVDADNFKVALSFLNATLGTQVTGGTSGGGTQTVNTGTVTAGVIDGIPASTIMQVAYNLVNNYFYSYVYDAGLNVPDTPVVAVSTAPSGSYTGLLNGAFNYKIAGIRDTSNIGTDLTTPTAPVKSIASAASAVVVPQNNTVQITFPTAETGQTHWAVFSTQTGFGGTGDFFRCPYRTSDNAGATLIWGISETTVAGAPGRTLEFDYRDGDLLPELAWIQDYAPPAGTNCVRLENVMVVLGAYDGSVASVSLPNFYESHNPFHLLYFPEAITAVLHRQVDNYAFVACRNSIHAVQYVGYRGTTLPSATVTTLNPEVGIAYSHNWALGGGQIACFVEGSGIAVMAADGSLNFEFGKEVHRLTKNWLAVDTVASFNPATRSFVFGNGDVSVSYSLQAGGWSCPVYTSDMGVTGTWASGINAQGELVATLNNSGAQTAYSYDLGSTVRVPTVSITNWEGKDTGRGKSIYEVQFDCESGTNVETPVVGVHQNLVKPYIRGCSVSGSTLTVPAWPTAADVVSKSWAMLAGTGVGNLTVSSVLTSNSTLNFASAHGMFTGQSITLATSVSLPVPLSTSATYYVGVLGTTSIKLATTLANALAGVFINISTTGSGTQTVVLNFLIARLTYVSATTATLTNPYTGASVSAGTSGSCFVLVGTYFYPIPIVASSFQHTWPTRPMLRDMRTWCLSVYAPTDGVFGQVLNLETRGTTSASSFVSTN